MSRLTDIKHKILQLDGGSFQELCDAYLSKIGYSNFVSFGMKSGTLKTKKGIPDTYFVTSRNKYVFVMYTTQQDGIFKKTYADIKDCLNKDKTGIDIKDIEEIVYCHTSANLSAKEDQCLLMSIKKFTTVTTKKLTTPRQFVSLLGFSKQCSVCFP